MTVFLSRRNCSLSDPMAQRTISGRAAPGSALIRHHITLRRTGDLLEETTVTRTRTCVLCLRTLHLYLA
jgi:hypothetical protein